ncbi:hypothetical protein [Synechocystis sp. LKSZ1]|uniref:hypothetical protein n=1 Tax=Synechocystis sp. LKSZ1 TaxID=3144951 RepID=UPI00336BBA85
MSNITPIQIFPGINDLPVEATELAGCNGSAIVARINKLISKTNYAEECLTEFSLYVDTVDGLDTNDGLTDTTPYKTLQKALGYFSGKCLDDCGYVYIYIKGEITGILDFTEIQSWICGKGVSGLLTLTVWPGDTSWKYLTPAWGSGDDSYIYTPTWKCSNYTGLTVSVKYCDFEIAGTLEITKVNLSLQYCTFNAMGLYSAKVFFGYCAEVRFKTIEVKTTNNQSITFFLDDCILSMDNPINWTSGPGMRIECFKSVSILAPYDYFHSRSTEITLDLAGSPDCKLFSPVDFFNFTQGIQLSNWEGEINYRYTIPILSHTIFIPTPALGRYLLSIPDRRCTLRSVAITAKEGTINCAPWANGSNVADYQSITFTGNDTITWFDGMAFSIDYPKAFNIYLDIASVTGVSDLWIQVNYIQ